MLRKDWRAPADEFYHGTGVPTRLVPTGGTAKLQSWSSPSNQFRHGTGSTVPMPTGGTGLPYDTRAQGVVPSAAAQRNMRPRDTAGSYSQAWASTADAWRHGVGSVQPMSTGGI